MRIADHRAGLRAGRTRQVRPRIRHAGRSRVCSCAKAWFCRCRSRRQATGTPPGGRANRAGQLRRTLFEDPPMAGRRIRTTSPRSLPEMQFSCRTWIPTGKASRSTRRRLSSARFERLSKPYSPFFRFENRRQRHQQHIRDIADPGSEAGDARVELEFAAGRGGGYSGCHRQHRDEGACERIRFSKSIALICGTFRRSAPPSCTHGVGGFERIFHAPTHEDRGEAQAVCESRAARLRGSGDVVCVGTDARAAARRRGGACASCRCGTAP